MPNLLCFVKINILGGYQMTQNQNSTCFKIPMFLCDRFGNLPLATLTKILVDVSGQHTNAIKGGQVNEYMETHNLAWIILQYHIELDRPPQAGEEITVTTHADGYNRLFCYRKFVVKTSRDKVLAEAEMTFAWLDMDRRKLVRLDPDIMVAFNTLYENRIRRLPSPEVINLNDSDIIKENFNIYYSNIDMNNHVNNTVYIQWAIDSLGIDFLTSHQIKSLNIKYDKEVLQEETVQVLSTIEKDKLIRSLHLIQVENQTNATVEASWVEK